MAEKRIAFVGGEEAMSYCDNQSLYVGLVKTTRDLGNSQIGPETLVAFHNGMKAWIPDTQLTVLGIEDEHAQVILEENQLMLSKDGEGLTLIPPVEKGSEDGFGEKEEDE